MRSSAVPPFTFPIALAIVCLSGSFALAQDAPPPIPRVVVDLRGTIPKFSGEPQLAASRDLDQRELPGVGIGLDLPTGAIADGIERVLKVQSDSTLGWFIRFGIWATAAGAAWLLARLAWSLLT